MGAQAMKDSEEVIHSKGYLAECIAELRKVSYPTRAEAMQATLVTLIIIGFMSLCVFFLDSVLQIFVSFFIGA